MDVVRNGAQAQVQPLDDSLRRARRRLSLAVMLAANALPLVGVLFWGWRLFDLVVIYWMETLIIGGYAMVQMAMTAGWFALFLVPFFTVHFGGFMAGHFVFLNIMFGDRPGIQFSEIPATALGLVMAHGLVLALIGLVISHGVGFVVYFLVPWLAQGRERRRAMSLAQAEVGAAMFGPYGRVIIMHVSIIIGGALVMVFGNRVAFLALLIALKTGSDLFALRRAERKDDDVPAVAATSSGTHAFPTVGSGRRRDG